MFAYVTIGTNDFDKSAQFFDAVMAALGYKRTHDYSESGWLGYGAEHAGRVGLCRTADGDTGTATSAGTGGSL